MSDLNCPDAAGSLNTHPDYAGLQPQATYKAPDFCIGDYTLTENGDDVVQEARAAENLEISGATLNVFKLLGNHEQTKLVDLVGYGIPMNNTSTIFQNNPTNWTSPETGLDVLTAPSWVGYDFGTIKTSYLQEAYGPPQDKRQHITSFRITQPITGTRALQVRVENSDGDYYLDSNNVVITGTGNGTITQFAPGPFTTYGYFMLSAISNTQFSVFFISNTTNVLGTATIGQRFNSNFGSFTILNGITPFVTSDLISAKISLKWRRVDIVNIPNTSNPELIRIKQSSQSRYWRLVPLSFSGVISNSNWIVQKLELFDFQATRLDDIQDHLFMENRDRDYAKVSIPMKAAYSPIESVSDLSKFGFQLNDTYIFTTVFAMMVKALGRPLVIGDIIELPNEVQYDHNLHPIRKFLEVTDGSWAAEGFGPQWRPFIYKFQASHIVPSQETRDLFGTVDTQKYLVDDATFLSGIEKISTESLMAAENNIKEAQNNTPEKGSNTREVASGMSMYGGPGSSDVKDMYVESGLPPDGIPYTEGYKLPDVVGITDGAYFRLNYDPKTKIPSRLYKFSLVKNKWLYVSTDRRTANTTMTKSQREIFERSQILGS